MTGWIEFVVAFGLFFVTHGLPVRPPVRRRLAAALGERGFTLAYSVLSLAMLGWLIVAAGRAPHVELWPFAPWQLWVPNLAMPIVVLLIALAIGRPNPLSFGGRHDDAFDPARPGLVGVSRHPLLLALAVWAAAHLIPNGNLAHVTLFGLFAAFAVVGMAIIDRRKRRLLGEAAWQRLAHRTGWLRLDGLGGLFVPGASDGWLMRLVLAVLAYGLILAGHAPLIGVSPLPG